MKECLSELATRYRWNLEIPAEGTSYLPSVVLFKEDLAITVDLDFRDADIGCTCYWLPGPYQTVKGDKYLSSVCLYSFGLDEFISERADAKRAKQDRRRLRRSVSPKNALAFRKHMAEVVELIETYAPDVLAGEHEALQRLGRVGSEGRSRGYASPERDAADQAYLRRYERREKWGGIGCGVILAIGILSWAISCHR